MNDKLISWQDLRARLLDDARIQEEYALLEEKYEMMTRMASARLGLRKASYRRVGPGASLRERPLVSGNSVHREERRTPVLLISE